MFGDGFVPVMVDCDYCGESFGDEDAYLDHLGSVHCDELGRIDRRRVEAASDGEDPVGTGTILLVAGVVVAIAAVGGAALLAGGAGGSGSGGGSDGGVTQPTALGSVHYHGTMEVVIDGRRIDFSRDRYQLRADAFHYEAGDGSQWHVHARQVTLRFALGTLGIQVNETGVTVGETTYRDGTDGTSVTLTVNGESVTPADYVLQEGDHVRLVVESGS
jgi:hypothetical protein